MLSDAKPLNLAVYKAVPVMKKDIAAVKAIVISLVRDASHRGTTVGRSVRTPTIYELMEAVFDDWVHPLLQPKEQLKENMSEAACWHCISAFWFDKSLEEPPVDTIKHAIESITATVEMSMSQQREVSPDPKPAEPLENRKGGIGVEKHQAELDKQPRPQRTKGATCPRCSHLIKNCLCEAPRPEANKKTAASVREPREVKQRCKGCKEFIQFCTCEESEMDHTSTTSEQSVEEEVASVVFSKNGDGADSRTAPIVCAPPRAHLAFRKAAMISDSSQWLTALQGGAPLDDLIQQLSKLYVRCPELYSDFGQKKTNEAAIEQIEDLMRGAWELQHEPGDVVEILRVNLGQSIVQATKGTAAAKAYKASHFKDEVTDKERRALKAANAAGKDDDSKSTTRPRGGKAQPDRPPKPDSAKERQKLPQLPDSVWTRMTAQERTEWNKARAAFKAKDK